MISAMKAKEKTDHVRSNLEKDGEVWAKLESIIRNAIRLGRYECEFVETYDCCFSESRKNIKARLEELGYKVNYSRYHCGEYSYRNIYNINWEGNL